MLKRIFVIGVLGASFALTGCATHRQSNELAGAAVGGVIGHAVGGNAGAVLGAGVGAMIGGQQPVQPVPPVAVPPVYIERQVIGSRRGSCTVFLDRYERCDVFRSYVDRMDCRADARRHYEHCMTR